MKFYIMHDLKGTGFLPSNHFLNKSVSDTESKGLVGILSSGPTYALRESQKEREREKGAERIFKEIMAQNFPCWVKDTNINI